MFLYAFLYACFCGIILKSLTKGWITFEKHNMVRRKTKKSLKIHKKAFYGLHGGDNLYSIWKLHFPFAFRSSYDWKSWDLKKIISIRDVTLPLFSKQKTKFTLFDFVFPKTLEMTSGKLLKLSKNNNSEKQS